MTKYQYDSFLVSVIVLLTDKGGNVLVGKRLRKNHPYYGYWEFPGGKLELGDTSLESAAIREVKEETNLNISRLKLLGAKYYPKSKEVVYNGISVCFKATKVTGKFLSLESSNLSFIPIEQALKLKLLPWVRYFLKRHHNDRLLK